MFIRSNGTNASFGGKGIVTVAEFLDSDTVVVIACVIVTTNVDVAESSDDISIVMLWLWERIIFDMLTFDNVMVNVFVRVKLEDIAGCDSVVVVVMVDMFAEIEGLDEFVSPAEMPSDWVCEWAAGVGETESRCVSVSVRSLVGALVRVGVGGTV